ncbi:MucB/RseB C-terminal domain-containing protein [Spiribacter halobius]|uniref:Transcriptional regulator n=1 Tax=Sediminicurvatus halobius TaxID=2182432 RepID=A0A2U2N3Y5_9GAMM|nr:MucB/RseB C-terminal domain-containing protein [Spiribacter halobius]PWG63758.1 hypothetical protein DEM34_07735 [Spiribacter halobius]UEX76240.1 MucB/RseB C-terminal domain-containing protein [Spiribacter halobius]
MIVASRARLAAAACSLLFGLALIAGAAHAGEHSAQAWLERVNSALRDLNYTGTFVYRYDGNIESLRIWHKALPGGSERERLHSLNGDAREILRDDDTVTCILPDAQSVVVDRRQASNPLSELLPADIAALQPHYRFSLRGEGRVAGRAAVRVMIEPRDDARYGYELWVDRDTGLLLRSDLRDDAGEILEQILFVSLEVVDSLPDSALEPHLSGEGFSWVRRSVQQRPPETPDDSWRITDLPPGFELRMSEMHSLPGSEGMVRHHVYSDGLATVSLYVDRHVHEGLLEGLSRMGAMNAYGRTIDGYQALVVGEVPAHTVERMARSLEHRAGTE